MAFQISENFHFDLNDDSLLAMISQHADCVDEASKCTQAIFSISQPLIDLFIVIRVKKKAKYNQMLKLTLETL